MFKRDELEELVAKELSIESFTEKEQSALIAKIGENIIKRVTLEILRVLPEDKQEEFGKLVGSGEFKDMDEFLKPYIPNLNDFVNNESKKEIEEFKQKVAE